MKILWALVAEAVEFDTAGIKTLTRPGITLFLTEAFPFPLPLIHVACQVELENAEPSSRQTVSVELNGPDGARLGTDELQIEMGPVVPNTPVTAAVVFEVSPQPIPTAGDYALVIHHNRRPLRRLGLAFRRGRGAGS